MAFTTGHRHQTSTASKTRALQTIAQFDALVIKQNELAAKLAEQPVIDGIQKTLDRAIIAQGLLPVFQQQESETAAIN